jgi:uncharacterized membrane protein
MISVVFIVAMLYMTFAIDKSALLRDFMATLNADQKMHYREIVNERRNIYYTGYGIGLVLSAIVIMMRRMNKIKMSWIAMLCLTGAISFLTSYFYYILAPKKASLMVVGLERRDQREQWEKVYRNMQGAYHGGLVIGILAVLFLTNAFYLR